jgi:hypothetical protein
VSPGRDELIALLRARDAVAAGLAAAGAVGSERDGEVGYRRGPAPADWLVDGDDERPLEEHRAAHRAGRPSEAALAYGAGVPVERTADRLLALAALAAETGLLRAVQPVPTDPTDGDRPGSWGVEDLTVIACARLVLPPAVRVRPHWRRLGPAACQVAAAFGADDWAPPAEDRSDLDVLAAAVGRRAVAR